MFTNLETDFSLLELSSSHHCTVAIGIAFGLFRIISASAPMSFVCFVDFQQTNRIGFQQTNRETKEMALLDSFFSILWIIYEC